MCVCYGWNGSADFPWDADVSVHWSVFEICCNVGQVCVVCQRQGCSSNPYHLACLVPLLTHRQTEELCHRKRTGSLEGEVGELERVMELYYEWESHLHVWAAGWYLHATHCDRTSFALSQDATATRTYSYEGCLHVRLVKRLADRVVVVLGLKSLSTSKYRYSKRFKVSSSKHSCMRRNEVSA